jgi:hypothetical protein
VNAEPIVVAGDEGDEVTAPKESVRDRKRMLSHAIVSVNGKDVEQNRKKQAA